MDFIDDPDLISDINNFAYRLGSQARQDQLYSLIARAVEAGRVTERRLSNPDDNRYNLS